MDDKRMERVRQAFKCAFEAMRYSTVENTDKDWFFKHPTLIEAMDKLGLEIKALATNVEDETRLPCQSLGVGSCPPAGHDGSICAGCLRYDAPLQFHDAGRVERSAKMKEMMEQIFHWVIVDGINLEVALIRALATNVDEVKP